MKKQLTIIGLLAISLSVKAQTKQYQQPDPKKSYTFTLSVQAVKVGDLQQIFQLGAGAIMDTEIPAKTTKTIVGNSADIINQLLGQLRKQLVADSLERVKVKK